MLNEDEILPRDFLKFYVETFQKVRTKTVSVLPISRIIHKRRPSDESICYLDKLAYRYRLWENSFIVIIIIIIIIIIVLNIIIIEVTFSFLVVYDLGNNYVRCWYGIFFFSCTELSRVFRKNYLSVFANRKDSNQSVKQPPFYVRKFLWAQKMVCARSKGFDQTARMRRLTRNCTAMHHFRKWLNIKFGWLVVLGLAALWDSISVYIGPSPTEREKKDRGE